MSDVSVSLKAVSDPASGRVVCDLTCDGQNCQIVFTGTDIEFAVPEPAMALAAEEPRILTETEPAPATE